MPCPGKRESHLQPLLQLSGLWGSRVTPTSAPQGLGDHSVTYREILGSESGFVSLWVTPARGPPNEQDFDSKPSHVAQGGSVASVPVLFF